MLESLIRFITIGHGKVYNLKFFWANTMYMPWGVSPVKKGKLPSFSISFTKYPPCSEEQEYREKYILEAKETFRDVCEYEKLQKLHRVEYEEIRELRESEYKKLQKLLSYEYQRLQKLRKIELFFKKYSKEVAKDIAQSATSIKR